jgi:hypothetical protein
VAVRPAHPRGAHTQGTAPLGPRRNEPPPRRNRPCYQFNPRLPRATDDRGCEHCHHYLTARCPHLEEFLDDLEDPDPE